MITFSFANLRLEPSHLNKRDALDVLLGVVADARFEARGRAILDTPELPAVELAAQLDSWLKKSERDEFLYESADAEELLLWLREVDGHWYVGSDWQPSERQECDPAAFALFAEEYVARVRKDVKAQLGIDVTAAFRQVR